MGRTPKPDPHSVVNWRPAPPPADYSDEVGDDTLKKLEEFADKKRDKDEDWEIVDGPAW
jgi:hypothetical protein